MYWDAEENPSVEVPLGDFFANTHGLRYTILSLPIAVNPTGGFNSCWPLPFHQRARITIESQYWKPIEREPHAHFPVLPDLAGRWPR